MSNLTTLKKPLKPKSFSTVLNDETYKVVNPQRITKIIFIPQDLTPLDVYEAELCKAGYSKADVKEIIDGLKDSPLYEGQVTQ